MSSLVLIAGSSGCGKSSLSQALAKEFTSIKKNNYKDIVLLHQDHYFTKPFLPYKERMDDSYENDSAVDWEYLVADLHKICTQNQNSNSIIAVVEGHILSYETLCNSFDFFKDIIVILIKCPRNICKYRRIDRNKRNNEEREELEMYYDKYVWPSYLRYGVPAMQSFRDSQVKNDEKIKMFEIDSDKTSIEENVQKIKDLMMTDKIIRNDNTKTIKNSKKLF